MKRCFIYVTCILFGLLLVTNIYIPYCSGAETHVYPGNSIQTAINNANDGDVIIVHAYPSTAVNPFYAENINFLGKAITVRSIDPDDFDITAATIISPVSGSVVTFNNAEDTNSVLSGFTIRNGSASNGGGVYCYGASPTITNCIVTENSCTSTGGGLYFKRSNPDLNRCIITKNHSETGGGGIFIYEVPTATTMTIYNCIISENHAKNNGGGIYVQYSHLYIANCVISENQANISGGGIYYQGGYVLTVTHSTFIKNSATGGAAVYNAGTGALNIFNSILWDDSPDEIASSNVTVAFSDIMGGYPGLGNLDTDPLFVNPNGRDYHLQPGSLCIDSGSNSHSVYIDLDGVTRPQDGDGDSFAICDMGAYELTQNPVDDDADGFPASVDCDDHDSTTYPGAPEACDGKDNDCDGLIPADENDADGDGFMMCEECNDSDADIHPGAPEICDDNIDNDCDGIIDECESTLTGRVFDLKTGILLRRVQVIVSDGSRTTTDINGEYTIQGIAEGPQKIRFIKRGYLPAEYKGIYFTTGRELVIDVGILRKQ